MIENIKSLKVNFSLLAFLCFMIKVTAFNATIADSIILLGLGALYAYTQYLKKFQAYKLDDVVMKDLAEVKSALSKINLYKATEKINEKKYF